ncbi:GNAT family N-acetyltransferase [Pseudoalteromonas luteoviolacea]|uniref:GNAT family N-acetyltransferase n=1 Tax=Pseudoalteromonas luteoviolacea TaxID=43657 RepID=UPI001B378EC9|nr:GNAT family N-acetyltransferase [Pseudoalteromonas luteoviolacea]MBQ4834853.1 GNAT family N-acetyltransferase [Pseudoalteromonas luteoviolacea]
MIFKKIEEIHWNRILEIQDESYQEVGTEELDVLKSKNAVAPDTCFVCVSKSGGVVGYLLAHPWNGVYPPKLFEPLPNITHCEYLYLHDMAISPQSKGRGVGRAAALKLFEIAKNKGMNKVVLVAVQGSESFWSTIGFQEVKGVSVCSSYGEKALLMEKVLAV